MKSKKLARKARVKKSKVEIPPEHEHVYLSESNYIGLESAIIQNITEAKELHACLTQAIAYLEAQDD